MLISQSVDCPYCGESNELEIDPSAGRRQAYTEDCQVCCRPWQVKVRIESDGGASVRLYAEDETLVDE
jgi:transposase-like protein